MTNDQKDQIKGTIALAVIIGIPLCFVIGPLPLIGILVVGFASVYINAKK